MVTFGRGARRCIAMNLAYAELFLTVATLVSTLEMQLFDTSPTGVEFKHDFTVMQPKLESKGVRVTVIAGQQCRP